MAYEFSFQGFFMMRKILIIDDERNVREVTKLVLEEVARWEVLVAPSGQDGLTIAQEEQPDAILLDVRMAVMDGIQTLQYLRRVPETCSIPVILFTSSVPNMDPVKREQLAIAGIIHKPIAPADLVNQICDFLNWPM